MGHDASTNGHGTPHRLALAAEAARLRDEGFLWREVADRLGVSLSYASELVNDPTGERASKRKEQYHRPCVDCGALVRPAGIKNAARRCTDCSTDGYLGRPGYRGTLWSDEDLRRALRNAAAIVGEPLTKVRYEQVYSASRDNLPSAPTIINRLGGWAAACRSAGLRAAWDCGGTYSTRLTYEQAVAHIAAIAREIGSVPYLAEYVGYRAINGGPSEANIRNRIKERYGNGSWAHIMRDVEAAL